MEPSLDTITQERLRGFWDTQAHKYVQRTDAGFLLPPQFLPQPGERVLDAGCGAGSHLGLYRAITAAVVGLDFSASMTKAARHVADTVQGDVQRLPFRDGQFDFVSSWGVISHVLDSHRALTELARVTKGGGRVLVVLSNRLSFLAPMRIVMIRLGKYTLGACRHYTLSTLRAEAAPLGLSVLDARALAKPPTAANPLRAIPARLGHLLDESVRRVYALWGGDLVVLFEKAHAAQPARARRCG